MKAVMHAGMLLVMMFFWGACEKSYSDAPRMGVDFSWRSTTDAGLVSPEIRLTGVPEGTRRFLVEMTDLDMTMADHGSGHVDYTGAPVIATGSVKGSYVGPRPPPGRVHTYEFTVKALNEEGAVIGIGRQTGDYPLSGDNDRKDAG